MSENEEQQGGSGSMGKGFDPSGANTGGELSDILQAMSPADQKAYWDGGNLSHRKVVDRVQGIFQQRYPSDDLDESDMTQESKSFEKKLRGIFKDQNVETGEDLEAHGQGLRDEQEAQKADDLMEKRINEVVAETGSKEAAFTKLSNALNVAALIRQHVPGAEDFLLKHGNDKRLISAFSTIGEILQGAEQGEGE
jgi:hypothetical protein